MSISDDEADQFVEKGLVEIDLSHLPLTEVVEKHLMPGMKKFWLEPDEFKMRFSYGYDSRRRSNDIGYVRRKDDEDKELFHEKEKLRDYLQIDGQLFLKRHHGLLETLTLVRNIGVGVVVSLAYTIDRRFPGWHLARRILDPWAMERHTLRCLHYTGTTSKPGVVAKPHTDIGGITLVIYETHKGVMAGQVMLSPGYIFAAQQIQLITEGKIEPTLHGVVEQRHNNEGHDPERRENTQNRQSVVLFVNMNTQPNF